MKRISTTVVKTLFEEPKILLSIGGFPSESHLLTEKEAKKILEELNDALLTIRC